MTDALRYTAFLPLGCFNEKISQAVNKIILLYIDRHIMIPPMSPSSPLLKEMTGGDIVRAIYPNCLELDNQTNMLTKQ